MWRRWLSFTQMYWCVGPVIRLKKDIASWPQGFSPWYECWAGLAGSIDQYKVVGWPMTAALENQRSQQEQKVNKTKLFCKICPFWLRRRSTHARQLAVDMSSGRLTWSWSWNEAKRWEVDLWWLVIHSESHWAQSSKRKVFQHPWLMFHLQDYLDRTEFSSGESWDFAGGFFPLFSFFFELKDSEMSRYDLVVFGASGYTGQFVAEEVARSLSGSQTWAVAGRNRKKLEAILEEASKHVGELPFL